MRHLLIALVAFGLAACSGGTTATTAVVEPTPAAPTATTSSTASATTAVTTTTSTAAPTTQPPPVSTTDPAPPQVAWTETEAERHVVNYLAALAAGAYEQAAWSALNNGIESPIQAPDESFAQALSRLCAGGSCAGPYVVTADGPGVLDLDTAQARSTVTVTHAATEASESFQLATFEGQLIIADIPPLVPAAPTPPLVEMLFAGDPPGRVVVERFNAFEIWEDGAAEWVTNWWAQRTHDVEGDYIAARDRIAGLSDPEMSYAAECPRLMNRGGEVLVLERCWSASWQLSVAGSSEPRATPIANTDPGDGAFVWFDERGGAVVTGVGDAEGNLTRLETLNGVDLLGDDYVSLVALSTDGRLIAYVDHSDARSYSHFWSPVVVVKNAVSGQEVGRWALDGPVLSLELAEDWVVAAETDPDSLGRIDIEQRALVAINFVTGAVNRVATPERLYLPA